MFLDIIAGGMSLCTELIFHLFYLILHFSLMSSSDIQFSYSILLSIEELFRYGRGRG